MKLIKGIIRDHIFLILILSFIFIIALLPKKYGLANDSKRVERIDNPHQVRDDKNLLKVAIEEVYDPLNPFFESSKQSSLYTKLIHKSLYSVSKDGTLEPDIADNIWYKNEGKDLHIVLKKDKRFKDGRKITSQDIINNILLLSDPSYDGTKSYYVESIGGYYQYKKRNVKDALKIINENDYYFIIQFSKASKDNLKILQMPIVPLEDDDFSYGDLSDIRNKKFTFGAGNYHLLNEYEKAIYLEKNQDDNNIIDKIYIEAMPYYKARSLYKRGQVDILYKYPSDEFSDKDFNANDKKITYFIKNQFLDFVKLGFNLRNGYFVEDDLRKALKNSIDFSEVLELKEGEKIDSPIYKNMRYYKDVVNKKTDTSLRDLVQDKEDKEISLAIYSGLEDVISKEEKLVEAFKKQGLNLKISHINEAEYYKIINGIIDYDMFIVLDQLITIPTLENQGIYDSNGDVSQDALQDYGNIRLLKWMPSILGYENYEFAVEKWQRWYHIRLPYITLKSNNQITAINKRLKGLYINEFIGIEEETNLKILNDLLK